MKQGVYNSEKHINDIADSIARKKHYYSKKIDDSNLFRK